VANESGKKNADLHGNVPESSPVAVLVVDVINDMEFEGGAQLLENALPAARRLAAFLGTARLAKVPVIYVNDNFGKWRSDFRALIDHVTNGHVRGSDVGKILAPDKTDYFVLKPKHSAFFSTTLDTLLEYLGAHTVVITGLTTDRCVMFTAGDAHMRDLHIFVPEDCCAAESTESHVTALTMMRRTLDVDTRPSTEIHLEAMGSQPALASDESGRGNHHRE
jgi:nicotinamidase-related amidase